MKFHSAFFAFSVTVLAQTVIGPSKSAGRLEETRLERVSVHAGTEGALRELSRTVLFRGVFGVESLGGPEPQLSMSEAETRLETIVQEICRQDPRYKVVQGENPRLINLLAAEQNDAGQIILNFRLNRLDIVKDDWPQNVIARLPEFSLELRRYLALQYRASGGKETSSPQNAAAGMTTDVKPPHFEIHLENVTVREALNAIAIHSLEMSLATGVDPRLISTPAEKQIFPTGWLFHVSDPATLSLDAWQRAMFSPLP